MKIATVLFTYNRPEHTRQVLEALRENTVLPEILYIFHDGIRENTDRVAWNEVENIIRGITWCKCIISMSEYNKGLADSVLDGVSEVLKDNDAVIVLEDDCVPQASFIKFMSECLKKYRNEKRIFAASGFSPNLNVDANGTDIYFTRRVESFGWGTWADRWNGFSIDYRILGRIKKNPDLNNELKIWGSDLENYLLGNIYGRCNSWATLWGLHIIENKGYCVCPFKSLIENIGFDLTGEHCRRGNDNVTQLNTEKVERFILSDEISISDSCVKEYEYYTKGYTKEFKEGYYKNLLYKWLICNYSGQRIADFFEKNNITNISIWGTGQICSLLIKEIGNNIYVSEIIVSNKEFDIYENIPVVLAEEVSYSVDKIIVIPGYDIDSIKKKVTNSEIITSVEEIIDFLLEHKN